MHDRIERRKKILNFQIHPAVVRFSRYFGIGFFTFLLDLGMLYGSVAFFKTPIYIAVPASFLLAVSLNYYLSRLHVFHYSERGWREGYVLFSFVAIFGALTTTTIVSLLTALTVMNYLVARTIASGIIGMGNYLFNLYFNFKVAGKQ